MQEKPNICFRCGLPIKEGEKFFNIFLQISSGFDGVITEGPSPERIREILDALETMTDAKIENDVYKELKIILCPGCKSELIKTLLGKRENSEKPENLVH